jgi:hypothetical protein
MEKKEEKKDKSKVKGGIARAKALTKTERSEIAKKAAEARWGSNAPKATHRGELKIGDKIIPCYVLEDGTRILARDGFLKAIGRVGKPKSRRGDEEVFDLPIFLRAENLKPFITEDLIQSSKTLPFQPPPPSTGKTETGDKSENEAKTERILFGHKAELLPQVCEVFLDAREAGVLHKNQIHIAEACKILYRGFATVGIIALVDEATGFQYDRARHALAEILENFISKELIKWVKTFPDEFYHHIFRLKGWKPSEIATRRPKIFGKITNDLVYERLTANVLKHLEELNPKNEKGRRKNKHFQRLTEDIGHPELRALLASEITVMRGFDDGKWDDFYKFLNRVLPKQTPLPLFDDLPDNELA